MLVTRVVFVLPCIWTCRRRSSFLLRGGTRKIREPGHEEVPEAIRRLQADDAVAKAMALAGQERMAQMDTEEVTHFAYQMLKGYAALQRFTPKRDLRSWEVNCEDDLTRHYDRGGETQVRVRVSEVGVGGRCRM